MNIVHLAGHLGQDAEVRYAPDPNNPNGQKVISLNLATKVRRHGQDETIWWRISLWGDQWDGMLPYFKKGTGLIVVGEISRVECYTSSRDGKAKPSLDVRGEIVKFSPFGKPESQTDSIYKAAPEGLGQPAPLPSFYKPAAEGLGQPAPSFAARQPVQRPAPTPPIGSDVMEDEMPF